MRALKPGNTNTLIFLCVMEFVVGILLLINPVEFTSGILIVFGIALLVFGFIRVVQYFRLAPQEAAVGHLLMEGLLFVLAGAFCAFHSQWFLETFPVLASLYGAVILVAGIGKTQFAVDRFRLQSGGWKLLALSAAVSILCAVILLINPFSATKALWLFAGITLLLEGGLDLAASIHKKENA